MTTKTSTILAYLEQGPASVEELAERSGLVGAKKIHNLCLYLQKRGKVVIDKGADGTVIYRLGKRQTGKQRRSKRGAVPIKSRRARRAAHSDNAGSNVISRPLQQRDQLILHNLLASTEHLAATLRREVEGVDGNPNLVAAIEATERASAIVRAAA